MFHILIHERHVNQKLYDSISSQSDWQLSRKQKQMLVGMQGKNEPSTLLVGI
jgi:hypothetical protein